MCETVLEGVCCTFAGPTDFLTVDGVLPPEVMLAQRFGATFSSEIEPCVTHLLIPASSMSELVACERTSVLLSQAHSLGLLPKLRVLDARWLLDSIALCEKLPEEEYHILLPTRRHQRSPYRSLRDETCSLARECSCPTCTHRVAMDTTQQLREQLQRWSTSRAAQGSA
eukprot:CAMPEP_0205897174 /NCGR_PEP_ID=MMETSP1083-20121108/25350_1 /ASSEMBLY_ACC=CAM_ASM_000430 /TAXON_ID=97485 /ORGANISM="Prymnesium parvum, Strain Texoma1" /LENGTH=168 /DNA_ID=CAMNT_0053262303 /DNA_START=15 /DNA_END=518 /DNA_ORIENTATION=+